MDASAETAEGQRTAPAGSAVGPPLTRRSAGRGVGAVVAVGNAALVVLVIVFITGGVTIDAGPAHVSAHDWRRPLLMAIVAFAAAAATGRVSFARAASGNWTFLENHASALSIVLAAATAGVGIACGTYSASSSDASGYVSESRLLASGQLATDEPLAREVAWANSTWAFSPLGYRPGREPGELVPTYPAGLPLVMAPARLIGGELAAYLVVPLLGAIAVLATYGLGAQLHSRLAGLVAALFMATSPIVLFQIVQPMSDVAVTAWWTLALLFAMSPLPSGPVAAGAASGLAVLTRPNLLPLAAVVALAVTHWPRGTEQRGRRRDRLIGFVAGIIPAVGAQFLTQWRLYGSPLASGYGAAGDLYSFGSIGPNFRDYVRRVLQGEAPAIGLAVFALVVLAVTRRHREPPPAIKRSLILALLAFGIVFASYLPYAVFAEWSYVRFLLPAFPLLFVLVGALLTNALLRLPSAARATTLLCALAVAGSVNVVHARGEQAFNMRRYESRYRFAGLYLASALPRDAVVVTAQESGSVRYYTGLPILRWDLLDVDLDNAIVALQAVRRHPVLIVEDWEAPQLAKKYPRSLTARLDWPARAEFGDETRVFLYDPADRGNGRRGLADRVH